MITGKDIIAQCFLLTCPVWIVLGILFLRRLARPIRRK